MDCDENFNPWNCEYCHREYDWEECTYEMELEGEWYDKVCKSCLKEVESEKEKTPEVSCSEGLKNYNGEVNNNESSKKGKQLFDDMADLVRAQAALFKGGIF